jgi:hypothetical protein
MEWLIARIKPKVEFGTDFRILEQPEIAESRWE